MDKDKSEYFIYEASMVRQERTIKRLWVLCILLIVLLVGTNAGWLFYESQFEDIVVEQEVDTGNGSAVVNGVGDINYGENQTDGENQTKENGR